ncbi:MAG: glycoside hydrolase family 16 protein [Dysosmobacter sp.]|nr:glycoside hydrolase family 16 protein [Dysosmobacter sp.]MDY3866271.1 glycoside hydrolase family 16 protein [Dysosmobacter sp.]
MGTGGLALTGASLFGCRSNALEVTSASAGEAHTDETVLFFEDFDGETLDTAKWSCETGYPRAGLQRYREENISLADSCLVLTAQREKNWEFTSGSVHTAGKFEFGPGTRVEVRAKLEGGPGAWPAIWLHSSRFTPQHPKEVWPAGGEIDLMEAYPPMEGFETTLHYRDETGAAAARLLAAPDADPGQWHTYGMLWTQEELVFTLDGQTYASAATGDFCTDGGLRPFDDEVNALFLHLNLAIQIEDMEGRKWNTAELPAAMRFLVDWVRVTSLEPPQPCWVAFENHQLTLSQYETLSLYVYTDPAAQDRTVVWEVENEWMLNPLAPNTVLGNLYAAHRGTTKVIVTTPSGGWDACEITVV